MRLSIIIPLYNVGDAIVRCLNSITPFESMEIIVVNDGSTDESPALVRTYIESHPYVKMIDKDNGGVSSARNMGIDNALGERLMFVDADDLLVQGALERLLALAEVEDADVLKFKIHKMPTGKEEYRHDVYDIVHYTIDGLGKPLEGFYDIDYHVVDGIFRRQTILNNHIHFRKNLYLHEDDVFMGEFLTVSRKAIVTNTPLYIYIYDSEHSHTHHPTSQRARLIVDSALLAVQYRMAATSKLNNLAVNETEKAKMMRFVYLCGRHMLSAHYSFSDYKSMLNAFRPYGCYPVTRQWLEGCASVNSKALLKNFLCNHPAIGWATYKLTSILK